MNQVFEFSAPAELENLKKVRTFVQQSGAELGLDDDTLGNLCLVVDEAVTNIIIHGYAGEPGTVDLVMQSRGTDLEMLIRDQARAFNPSEVETPHLDEPLAERKYGGMGVFLIRKLTDEAEFRCLPQGGNELYLLKREAINPQASAG